MQLIRNLFSKDECDKYMMIADEKVTNRDKAELLPDHYGFQDENLVRLIEDKLKTKIHLPSYIDSYGDEFVYSGIYNNFNLYRFHIGYQMKKHVDYVRDTSRDKRIVALLIIYLNTVPVENGGATYFNDLFLSVQPEQGNALAFMIDKVPHKSTKLKEGTRYSAHDHREYPFGLSVKRY